MPRITLDPARKAQIIAEAIATRTNGEKMKDVAARHGVTPRNLYQWVTAHEKRTPDFKTSGVSYARARRHP